MSISTLPRPTSLVEGVCQQLADLIREPSSDEERWLPGERSLAEQLGVSRTVVREATKRLEQQGMLEIQHGAGIKVVDKLHRPLIGSLSILIPKETERLRQLNEARLAIEPECARLAATRATASQIKALWALHRKLVEATDNDAAIEIDLAFHRALAQTSGNLIFRLILDSLAEIGLASRRRTIGRVGKNAAIAQHATILGAVEKHDAEAAEAAMRHHILSAGEDMQLEPIRPQRSK
ncbi:MAG: FadR family transcriptional regulator [Verrucomicrobiales bacterium]|nr:FadR family transcriptional regulator [Verrucomicrobiales bacterium]MCP5556136.1 FadR family transcriptional regulator [Verrucomicrobiaceae bacterium]